MAVTDSRERAMTLDQPPTHPDLLTDERNTRSRGERLFVAVAVGVTVLAVAGIGYIALDKDAPAPPPPAASVVAEVPPVTAPAEEPAAKAPEQLAAAAAEERYREFLRIDDAVGQGGYTSSAPYDRVSVLPERATRETLFRQTSRLAPGVRLIGSKTLASVGVTAVDLSPEPGGYPMVILQACVDVSGVDVVDESGKSLVSAERMARSSSTVTMYQYEPGTPGAEAGGWFVYEATAKGEAC